MGRSPFEEAKMRTARGEILQRERIVKEQMAKLLALRDESKVRVVLETVYGIKPGSKQYEEVIRVWRELSSLP
jgi:hypothetical protein